MPYQIIYSSRASGPMGAAELEQILADAREGNEARDVTGALVFADGVFVQVLEGEREVVRNLAERIRADSRHDSMKIFYQREVGERAFGDWRMAYLTPDTAELAHWAGLEATGTVDELLEQIRREPPRVPRILIRIVEALAGHAKRA